MATDLRTQHMPRIARRSQVPRGPGWAYVLTAVTLIVVTGAAAFLVLQGPPQQAVRIGSYPELARTEAREGGPYAQAADPCYVYGTIPGRGGPPVRVPCERPNGPTATPAERNSFEAKEGGPYACTVSLPPCWDPNP